MADLLGRGRRPLWDGCESMHVMCRRYKTGCVATAVLMSLGAVVHAADTNTFTQLSEPAGHVDQVTYHQTTSEVSTVTAPWLIDGDRFTHWTVGSTELSGTRIEDVYGRAINPVRFIILEDTVAVAHFLPQEQDADGDGVPDWYEIHFFDTTNHAAFSDADADGLTLREEYRRDLHPRLVESVVDGGTSRRRSGLVTVILHPDYHLYTETSDPAGFVSRSLVVSNGNAVATPSLHGAVSGFEFGYWTIDGVRREDANGRAVDVATTVVTANVAAVAHYFKATDDTDADGIPDWWEWHYLGGLDGDAGDDPDGDGLSLLEEYRRDLHPMLDESVTDGSASRRRSGLTTYDISGLLAYTINSLPPGFEDSSGYATNGQVVATPSLHGDRSGFTFAYWTVNGIRAEDSRGVALDQAVVPLFTNTIFTAHYFKTTDDLDGDSIQDWWEWAYLGGTNSGASVDHDGDGLTALEEFRRDLDPTRRHVVRDGGASRRRSSLTLINMQFFERLAYVQVDGIVSNFFTIWPPAVTGLGFGTNSAPALGDWDGDGDMDLFVTSGGGLLACYQNMGSPRLINLVRRDVPFAGLVADRDAAPISCGDWSGDGRDDLAVGAGGSIRLRSSPGDFASSPGSVPDVSVPGVSNAVPALGDLDGDGWADLAVLTDQGQVLVFTHSGNPGSPFGSVPDVTNALPEPVPQAVSMAIADVDDVNDNDLLVTDMEGRTWEFRAQSGGQFLLYNKMWAGTGHGFADRLTLAIADLDGDKDVDAICGYAQGGLMLLRDPRVGIPSGLAAIGGADSILLAWDPNTHYRIRGYNLYRSADSAVFGLLDEDLILSPEYRDNAVVPGPWYGYYVTAVSAAYLPGNTVPRYVETDPSATVTARVGHVDLWLPDYYGRPGSNAVLMVNCRNAYGIAGNGLEIRIAYDPARQSPASQVSTNQTVENTALTANLLIADNGETASGELIITGTGGTAIGEGHLFDINFVTAGNAVPDTVSTNRITQAALFSTSGVPLTVSISDTALFTVLGATGGYFLGDLDGDGILNMDDHQLLMELLKKDSRPPTPQELYAGDLNGNGELDHGDIPLLLRLIHGNARNP